MRNNSDTVPVWDPQWQQKQPRPMIFVDHSLSAEALRDGRMALGLTQRQMARKLRMEAGTYSACENGKRRFPIQRLQLLPRDLALKIRDALVEEFGTDLDGRIEGKREMPKGRKRPSKPLAIDQEAALD